MEEAHKAVLKWKRVHDDKIVPVPDKIKDHNTMDLCTIAYMLHIEEVLFQLQ